MCGQVIYEVFSFGTQVTPSFVVLQIDSDGIPEVSIYSSDAADVGTHQLELFANLEDYPDILPVSLLLDVEFLEEIVPEEPEVDLSFANIKPEFTNFPEVASMKPDEIISLTLEGFD